MTWMAFASAAASAANKGSGGQPIPFLGGDTSADTQFGHFNPVQRTDNTKLYVGAIVVLGGLWIVMNKPKRKRRSQ